MSTFGNNIVEEHLPRNVLWAEGCLRLRQVCGTCRGLFGAARVYDFEYSLEVANYTEIEKCWSRVTLLHAPCLEGLGVLDTLRQFHVGRELSTTLDSFENLCIGLLNLFLGCLFGIW